MKEILFFGGKGGVGKTSCSTSYSIYKSKEAKTLLVSTDPAHSISDLFNKPIGDEITFISENLYGLEINGEKESQNYINKIRGNLHTIMSPIILEEINRQLDSASVSPGTHESALFDKMIDIIINNKDEFEYIIFDTAPTGHTLRLLSLPEILGAWINSLIKKRRKVLSLKNMMNKDQGKKDPVIEILLRRKKNMDMAREIMIDKGLLKFVFVLNAEKMPISETKKAVDVLQQNNIEVSSLIINKILPESNDSFWKDKKAKELEYISMIEKDININKIYKIPMFKEDMDDKTIYNMVDYFASL